MSASAPVMLAFVLACALLCCVPFVPAVREWLRPTDAAPLRVLPDYNNDIDHFASRLALDAAAAMGRGPMTGREVFDAVATPVQAMDWPAATRRLLARETVSTRAAVRSPQPLYVDGSVCVGPDSRFTAVYSTADIELGAGSEVSDWAHADGLLSAGHDSGLQRRASAGTAIRLAAGGRFERLHAPEVSFGEPSQPRTQAGPSLEGRLADLPGALRQTASLYMVRGDCVLSDGRTYEGSLIVTGFLSVGAGTTLVGDVKARQGVALAEGAAVHGALTCERRVHLARQSYVQGPVVSETDILLESGTRIGQPDRPTTVSGRDIVVDEGVTVHGSIWAHELGMVRAL